MLSFISNLAMQTRFLWDSMTTPAMKELSGKRISYEITATAPMESLSASWRVSKLSLKTRSIYWPKQRGTRIDFFLTDISIKYWLKS